MLCYAILYLLLFICNEVENDVARREAVKGLESAVQELHTAFDTIRDELGSKAGVDKVEASLLDMAQMLKGATAQQVIMHNITILHLYYNAI
jgi:hypothetical protein